MALIPDSQTDDFWPTAARNLIKMLAKYFMCEEKVTPTFQMIYQKLCEPDFNNWVDEQYPNLADPSVKNLFSTYKTSYEKTRAGISQQVKEFLEPFNTPNLANASNGNDFDFNELRKSPVTIYLIIPASGGIYQSLISIFFEQMICANTMNEPDENDCAINAMIDEFANIPKMPTLAQGISYLRSYRIRVCTFIQYTSQITEIYGQNFKDGFMAAPLKIAFKITDLKDAEYFSELAGKKTIKVKNDNHSSNRDSEYFYFDRSSGTKQTKNLLTKDEIMWLKPSDLLIYKSGSMVIKATKNFWTNSRSYKKLYRSIQ
jgi:type IV secretion system protein VirD4